MTVIVKDRDGGNENFDQTTLAYAKAISEAMTALAPAMVGDEAIPKATGDNELALAVDAVPAIRALVTIAGAILQHLPPEALINTTENSLKVIAHAAGPQFAAYMTACNASRRGDAMDARANVAGFTRPLRREDYN